MEDFVRDPSPHLTHVAAITAEICQLEVSKLTGILDSRANL